MERAEGGGEQTPKADLWDEFAKTLTGSTPEGESNEPVEAGTTEEAPATTDEAVVEAAEPTADAIPEDSGRELGLDAVKDKGLESVPTEYRDVVRQAVEATEKAFKAQFTKKTQELAALKKQYDQLTPLAEKGVDLQEVPKIIDQYKTLVEFLKRDDVKILQGDEVIKAPANEEPDLEALSPAEQAKWYKAQLAKVKAEVTASARAEVEPLKKEAAMAGLKKRFDDWRASRKDVSDEVLQLARAHALAYEQKLGKLFGAEFFEDLDASMQPFIAQARLDSAQAKKTAAKKVAPSASTELPNSGLKPSSYNGKDLFKAFEAARKEMGIK